MANKITLNFDLKFNTDQTGLNSVSKSLTEITNKMNNTSSSKMTETIKQGGLAAQELNTILSKTASIQLDKGNLTTFSKNLSSSSMTLTELGAKLTASGTKGTVAFASLSTQIAKANVQIKDSHTLLNSMFETFTKTIKWGLSASAFNYMQSSFQQSYAYAKELDTSLNNIRIVTGKSADDMERFASSANSIAKNLGSTTTQVTDAALIYYQQGDSDEVAAAKAETTIKAANVTGQTGDQVSEQLTAVWNGYKVTAEEAESYIDKLAAVAASTASNLEELSTGMGKVASAANTMGVDIDQLNATLATVVSVTRDAPESVGTAFKTIYARMGDIEAGLDEETTLGNYTEKMNEMGVNVLNAQGQLRDMGEVIEEVGGKWETMSREQQIALSQVMAGTRQYNNLLSLFGNWDMYEDALATSQSAEGTLDEQNEIYMDSVEARLNQLTASIEDFWKELFDEDAFKGVLGILETTVDTITTLTSSLGGGMTAIAGFAAVASSVFSKQIGSSVATAANNLSVGVANEQQYNTLKEVAQQTPELKTDTQSNYTETAENEKMVTLLNKSLETERALSAEDAKQLKARREEMVAQAKITAEKEYQLALKIKESGIDTEGRGKNELLGLIHGEKEKKEDGSYVSEDIGEEGQFLVQSSSSYVKQETEDLKVYTEAIESSSIALTKQIEAYQDLAKTIEGVKGDRGLVEIQIEKIDEAEFFGPPEEHEKNKAEELISLKEELSTYNKRIAAEEAKIEKISGEMLENITNIEKAEKDVLSTKDKTYTQASRITKSLKEQGQYSTKELSSIKNTLKEKEKLTNAQKKTIENTKELVGLEEDIKKVLIEEREEIIAMSEEIASRQTTSEKVEIEFDNKLDEAEIAKGYELAIQGVTSALSSYVSTVALVSSLGSIWSEEDLTIGEKVIQTITTLSFTLPSLISSYKALSEATKGANKALMEKALTTTIATLKDKKELVIKALNTAATNKDTMATITNTAAKGGLTAATWLLILATKALTFALSPVGIVILAIIAAITIATQAFSYFAEKKRESAKESAAAATALREEATALREAAEAAADAVSAYQEGTISKQEMIDTIVELNDYLDKEAVLVALLTGNYEDLTAMINEASLAILNEEKVALQKEKSAYERSLVQEAKTGTDRYVDPSGDFNISLGRGIDLMGNSDYEKAFAKGMLTIAEANDNFSYNSSSGTFSIEGSGAEDIADFRSLAEDLLVDLQSRADYKKDTETTRLGDFIDETAEAAMGITESVKGIAEIDLNLELVKEDYSFNENSTKEDFEKGIDNLTDFLIKQNPDYGSREEAEGDAKISLANDEYFSDYISKAASADAFLASIEKFTTNYDDIQIKEYVNGDLLDYSKGVVKPSVEEDSYQSSYDRMTPMEPMSMMKQSILTPDIDFSTESLGLGEVIKNAIEKAVEGEGVTEALFDLDGDAGAMSSHIFSQIEAIEDLTEAQRVADETAKAYAQSKLDAYDAIFKLTGVSEAELEAVEMTTGGFEDYVKKLKETRKEVAKNADSTEDAEKAYQKIALAQIKAERAAENLVDVWDDSYDALKDVNKGTAAYSAALSNLTEAFNDVVDADFSESFVEENLDAIEDFVTGSETAFDSLRSEMAEEVVANFELKNVDGEILAAQSELISFAQYVEDMRLEGNLDIDTSSVVVSLNEMLSNFSITAEEAQKYLSSIGYTADLSDTELVRGPETTTKSTTTITDPNGGQQTFTSESVSTTEMLAPVIKDVQAIDTPSILNPSTNTRAGGSSGSSGGSSGSTSESKVEDKAEDEKDVYHDINITLKQLSNTLSKVQSQTDKLFGSKLIQNYQEQYDLLAKNVEAYAEKIKIAQSEAARLKSELSGFGVTFNADGTIANYAAAYDSQLAILNGVIDKYNAMSADAQDGYQDTLDAAKEAFDDFLDSMSEYDDTVTSIIPDLEQDIIDALDEQIELQIEAFHMEIEIKLDLKEAEQEWADFYSRIIEGVTDDDILGQAATAFGKLDSYYREDNTGILQENSEHVQEILDELAKLENGEASNIYSSGDVEDNMAQALEDLQTYYEESMSLLEEYQDLLEEVYEYQIEMLDETAEKLGEQAELYDTIRDLIDHDMNIVTLLNGEEDYITLQKFYEMQEENNNSQLEFNKMQVDFWAQQMASFEEGSEAWLVAKESWIEAVSDWNSAIETSIENLQDKYLNTIQAIFQELNDQITNGAGLNYLGEEWSLMDQYASKYLDTVNGIYEIQSLENKYQNAIDSTDSLASQQKLNDLMEDELNLLKEKDNLTQYDIDRANMKYEIALKQIALEEAQQNKSTMRLKRDSQGNYSYAYVEDESQVAQLQQELSDLYNQLYNLDSAEYQSNLNELYDVWTEFQEKMAAAAEINDPEERAAYELLIQEEYGEYINALISDNETLKNNLYQSTMSQLFDLYNQNEDNYYLMTEEQREILDQFLTEETDLNTAAFDNLFGLYNENIAAFENMTEEQKDILMGSMVPQWNSAIQDMADTIAGEGGFEEICKDAFEAIQKATSDYEEGLKELEESAGVTFDEIQDGINTTIDDTQDLVSSNQELIDTYQELNDEMKSIVDSVDKITSSYEAQAEAINKTTEAAYNYWVEQQRQAGEDAEALNDSGGLSGSSSSSSSSSTSSSSSSSGSSSSSSSLSDGQRVKVSGPIYVSSTTSSNSGTKSTTGQVGNSLGSISANGRYHVQTSSGGQMGWFDPSSLTAYDTGGYTGEWENGSQTENGRVAMLHQKEMVLNEEDTSNMLQAIDILRSIVGELKSSAFSKINSLKETTTIPSSLDREAIEQNVQINADFPNVKDASDIEEALNSLVNKASQRILAK